MEDLTIDDIEAIRDKLSEDEYLELLYYNYPSIWIDQNIPNPQDPAKNCSLRDYQIQIVNDKGKRKILRLGRQIGKSFTLQCLILYYGITRPYSKILVVGPQKTHVDSIFDEVETLISASSYLKSEVSKTIKQPRYIKFKNGSEAKGFTTGEDSGGKGLSIRGKCQPAGSKIHMADGTLKNIENMQNGDVVVSFDEDNASFTSNVVTNLIDNGVKETYRVQTSTGRYARVTDNHPFYSEDGSWKDITTLKVGDYIAIPGTGNFGSLSLDDATSLFLAYMIGDGTCGTTISYNKHGYEHTKIAFSVDNQQIENEFTRILDYLNFEYKVEKDKRRENLKSIRLSIKGMRDGTNKAINLLKKYDLFGKYSYQKSFGCLMKMNKNTATKFINRLFSTDGWGSIGSRGECEIGYCSSSEELIKELQILLDRFGISSKIRRKQTSCRDTFVLSIRDSVNIMKFLQNIGFIYGKSNICRDIQEICKNREIQESIGIPSSIVFAEKERLGKQLTRNHIYLYNSKTVSIEKLKDINSYIESDLLQKYIDGDIIFDRIVSIEKTGQEKTYGLAVDKNHTYLTDGIVSHNTANILLVDEADYINDDVMDKVVIPTTNSFSDPIIILSSTPTGRRGFFRNSWDSGFYSTFHFPSSVSPTWSKEKEAQIKATTTKLAFTHEYLADWSSQESGLFSKEDMSEAAKRSHILFPDEKVSDGILRQYSYNDNIDIIDKIIKPRVRMLGVDWNKSPNGTRLVWVDFDDNHNAYVRGKWKIDVAEFTQNTAIQKIKELSSTIRFDYIMIDIGYGSMQLEDLHLYGLKFPGSRFSEIVKPVQTDGSIEIKDIATGGTRKTYIKNFIVESTVRFMEQHRIRIPSDENLTDKRTVRNRESSKSYTLMDCFNEFKIARYTSNGRPVYECNVEDHDVDAFMFTIYGYLTEVIKSQNMWSKLPAAKPAYVSYDTIMKNRFNNNKDDESRCVQYGSPENSYSNNYVSSTGGPSRTIRRSSTHGERSLFGGRGSKFGGRSAIKRSLR